MILCPYRLKGWCYGTDLIGELPKDKCVRLFVLRNRSVLLHKVNLCLLAAMVPLMDSSFITMTVNIFLAYFKYIMLF